ncbi:MAG: T9SS type A sorting domain-containing protein, partial [Bacteroidota bacterium]
NVGIEKADIIAASFTLSPNPAAAYIYITTAIPSNKKTTVTIYDSKGQEYFRSKKVFANSNKGVIDLFSFPPGIYFCRLSTFFRSETLKFIISR